MALVKFWNLEVLSHLVVTVVVLKCGNCDASNGTSNILVPRSYNTSNGTSGVFEI
jgi:hypothetical protein